jgi:tetratricopeptide (TPR) repeat protein
MQGRLDDATKTYDDVVRIEGPDSKSQNGPWARLGRAEVLQGRGRLGDALIDADAAVATFDRLGATGFAGYARLRRGLVATELGRTKDAAADFDAAFREAKRDAAGLADLAARVELARDLLGGKPAVRPSPTVKAAIASSPVFRAGFAANRCESSLLRGEVSRAETWCRSAVDDAAAQALDATSARASLAEALRELKRFDEARIEARTTFDDASRLGLPLPAARAAGVLVALPGSPQPGDAKRGLELLDAYVEGAPTADRDRINRRPAITRLRRALQSASANPSTTSLLLPRPVGG